MTLKQLKNARKLLIKQLRECKTKEMEQNTKEFIDYIEELMSKA